MKDRMKITQLMEEMKFQNELNSQKLGLEAQRARVALQQQISEFQNSNQDLNLQCAQLRQEITIRSD